MAANLSELSKTWLFRARMECGAGNHAAQIDWLYGHFKTIEENGTAEVTATAFKGQSASMQHRGSTPEDNMTAIQSAIEHLEGILAGNAAASFSKPFGFRFGPAPADVLDAANSTLSVP